MEKQNEEKLDVQVESEGGKRRGSIPSNNDM